MKTRSFTPKRASARAFHARLWLAFQPEDRRIAPGELPGEACLWGLILFNGGPALKGVILEWTPATGGPPRQFRLGAIPQRGTGHLFLGGPSEEPAPGLYRVWARGLNDAPVFFELDFQGFTHLAWVPELVANQPVLPVAPGAVWDAREYVQILEQCSLLSGRRDLMPVTQAASRWADLLLRSVHGVPSAGAAREIAWATLQAVFGAREQDLEQEAVRALLHRIGSSLRQLARTHAGPDATRRDLVAGRLFLALTPGPRPRLFLLNLGEEALADVRVKIDRFCWSCGPLLFAPLEHRLGTLAPHSATEVASFDARDRGSLEVSVGTGPAPWTRNRVLHTCFPEVALKGRDATTPLPILGGRRAQVRAVEAGHEDLAA
ncbi:MAG: hypothetical protein ACE5H3_12095 [Planctomycetota bacterium]